MTDYNIHYYNLAKAHFQDMKYYYGNLTQDCVQHLLRYFPKANPNELMHAVNWALADAWNGGCEVETT